MPSVSTSPMEPCSRPPAMYFNFSTLNKVCKQCGPWFPPLQNRGIQTDFLINNKKDLSSFFWVKKRKKQDYQANQCSTNILSCVLNTVRASDTLQPELRAQVRKAFWLQAETMLTKVWTYKLGAGRLGLVICFFKVLFSPTVVAQMSDQELRIMAMLLAQISPLCIH